MLSRLAVFRLALRSRRVAMLINAATQASLDLIAARGAEVRAAFAPIQKTGDFSNVNPPGNDYFVTADERGRTSYTRDGRFSIADGAVVGENRRPVLGFSSEGGALRELHVDPVDQALGRVNNLRVSENGAVQYDRSSIDPRSGTRESQTVTIGYVALARFPAGTRLPTQTPPHVGRANDGNFGLIGPMRRENDDATLDRTLDRLHDAYVAFDALQAAHKAQGHVGKTVMDLIK
jgi:hypothetical protein